MKIMTVEHLKECTGIGIDVSKESLAVAGITPEHTHKVGLTNSITVIKNFAKKLVEANYTGKIICESTGHYHLKLALIFSQYNLNLYVVNPLQSSKYSKSNVRGIKTDPVDAEGLAEMCLTERKLPKPVSMTKDNILIRLKMGQINSTEKQIQRMQGSLNLYAETYRELGLTESEIQQELKAILKHLKQLKGRMYKELEELISEKTPSDEVKASIQSVPGIASTTAALISQFDRDVKGPNSWVAYIGFDTRIKQSGKWKGRGKLTKRGNRYLRKKLFQSAWGAMMHDEDFKAYYERLREGGRSYFEAICILAKKQLRIAYTLATTGKKYDPKIAFSGQKI